MGREFKFNKFLKIGLSHKILVGLPYSKYRLRVARYKSNVKQQLMFKAKYQRNPFENITVL